MNDLDPMIREWLYAREVCRRLGFTPDEIFFTVAPSGRLANRLAPDQVVDYGKPLIAVELRRDGLTFVWTIGPIDLPADQIEGAYIAACNTWNSSVDTPESDARFKSSRSFSRAVDLVISLNAKGFSLRKVA